MIKSLFTNSDYNKRLLKILKINIVLLSDLPRSIKQQFVHQIVLLNY